MRAYVARRELSGAPDRRAVHDLGEPAGGNDDELTALGNLDPLRGRREVFLVAAAVHQRDDAAGAGRLLVPFGDGGTECRHDLCLAWRWRVRHAHLPADSALQRGLE